MRAVTMLTTDRVTIQHSVHLIDFILFHLDGIDDVATQEFSHILSGAMLDLKDAKNKLSSIESRAVTYQLRPGNPLPE